MAVAGQSERAGHPAAARIEDLAVEAGARQHPGPGLPPPQRLVMAVRVHERRAVQAAGTEARRFAREELV
jgi:hypothetical protein